MLRNRHVSVAYHSDFYPEKSGVKVKQPQF